MKRLGVNNDFREIGSLISELFENPPRPGEVERRVVNHRRNDKKKDRKKEEKK